MDVAGESHLFHGLLFCHAKDQDGISGGDVQHTSHSIQGGVGGVQHGGGGDSRSGQGLDRAAFLHVQANELLGLVLRQPARAKAGGLGKAGITDLCAGDLAVGIHAQCHGDGAGITAGGRYDAVADGLTILLGLDQGGYTAALGDGHFSVLVRSHHGAESLALGSHGVLLDGALGDGVGGGQRQGGDQADDRQHQECGQLFLLNLVGHVDCLLEIVSVYLGNGITQWITEEYNCTSAQTLR